MIQIRIFSVGLAKSPSLPSARNDLGNCLPSKGAFSGEGNSYRQLLGFQPVMGEDFTTMQLCPFLANSLGEGIQRRLDLPAAQCKEVQFPCFLWGLCKSTAGIHPLHRLCRALHPLLQSDRLLSPQDRKYLFPQATQLDQGVSSVSRWF